MLYTFKTLSQWNDVVYNIREIKNYCNCKEIKRKTEKQINTLTLLYYPSKESPITVTYADFPLCFHIFQHYLNKS